MGLFENLPFTNFENMNLDMILKDIAVMKSNEESLNDRVELIESGYSVINESIQNIQGDITNIYNQLGEIDLTALEARVDAVEADCTVLHNSLNNVTLRLVTDEENIETNTDNIDTNNTASINRDNALSARISQLERATLHDIYNYYSDGNMLLFGSDLRGLPQKCREADGYPICYGNTGNRHLYVNTTKSRAWKFSALGLEPNDSSTDGYDYYQMGQYPPSIGVADMVTVTFAVSTGGDATPTWYQHTFQAQNEQWTVASGCIIRFGTFLDNDNSIYTVQLLGTPANWRNNVVTSGKYIVFFYVEWGTGSVSTGSGDKCKFSIKDREFFNTPAPALPAPSTFNQNGIAKDADAVYYDSVGDPVSYKLPTRSQVRTWWFNKILGGFIQIYCQPTSEATGVSQLDGIQENGCYAEFDIDLTDSTIPVLAWHPHFPVYDMIGNKQGEAYLTKGTNDTNMTKIHIKMSSTGFAIEGATDLYLSIPLSGFAQ